jgi:hypothetical protein
VSRSSTNSIQHTRIFWCPQLRAFWYTNLIQGFNEGGRAYKVCMPLVQDDPNLPDDSGEVSIYEWSGWRFDSRYEIFSLLDEKNYVGRYKGLQ